MLSIFSYLIYIDQSLQMELKALSTDDNNQISTTTTTTQCNANGMPDNFENLHHEAVTPPCNESPSMSSLTAQCMQNETSKKIVVLSQIIISPKSLTPSHATPLIQKGFVGNDFSLNQAPSSTMSFVENRADSNQTTPTASVQSTALSIRQKGGVSNIQSKDAVAKTLTLSHASPLMERYFFGNDFSLNQAPSQASKSSTTSFMENLANLNQTTPTAEVQPAVHNIRKRSGVSNIQPNHTKAKKLCRNLFKCDLLLTGSLKIVYKDEYKAELLSYMSNVLNITADAANVNNLLLKTWATLFVHMIVEMLSRISKVDRLRSSEFALENLPANSAISKFLIIAELFNENYNFEFNQLTGIQKLALHPGSYFPIQSRFISKILCNIYANDDCNEIHIDFYNSSDINEFNIFYNAIHTQIDSIIQAYFTKINFFYIYDEFKEYTFNKELIPNQFDIGIIKDPCEIQLYQENFLILMDDDTLTIVEKFIQKFHSEINLIDNRQKVCELWVKFTSSFIIDILSKIFAAEFKKNYHELKFSDKEIALDMTCSYDVITNRSQYNRGTHSRHGILPKEILKTIGALRSGLQFERQLRSIVCIKSDDTNKLITITFYNLHGPKSFPMGIFLKQFKSSYKKLLENYFEKLLGGYIVFTKNPSYL